MSLTTADLYILRAVPNCQYVPETQEYRDLDGNVWSDDDTYALDALTARGFVVNPRGDGIIPVEVPVGAEPVAMRLTDAGKQVVRETFGEEVSA